MHSKYTDRNVLVKGVAILLIAVLAGCDRPPPRDATPAPDVPPPQVSSDSVAPAGELPLVPAAESGPLANTAEVPELAAMTQSASSGTPGVPVDLRYQFDSAVVPDQPAVLHLAAVPQVAGSNLAIRFEDVAGIRTSARTLRTQRADAAVAYRQQLSVTRASDSPAELRLRVTMDLPDGPASGSFTVPLAAHAVVISQDAAR